MKIGVNSFVIVSLLLISQCEGWKKDASATASYSIGSALRYLSKGIFTAALAPGRKKMIHEPDPQSLPVVITIFARVVCPSVLTYQNLIKQNKVQARIVIATGGTVGLAECIIDSILIYFD